MRRTATVRAFAKVNLSLEVLNRRPDGFHNLRTVFQTISLHDTIDIDVRFGAEQPSVSLTSDVDIPGENLVVRAAHSVLQLTGVTADVRFVLHKRIPMGGGLGGGSTDAAAVLLALPELLGVPVATALLIEAGSKLGSDVPFFLTGGTAVGLGRGTELYPLPDAQSSRTEYGLLLAPSVHVSTPEAYRLLGRTTDMPVGTAAVSPSERLAWALSSGSEWSDICVNDFESAVFGQHPLLGDLRSWLERLGARPARMTGSGAAVYGLFETEAARQQAAVALADTVTTHLFEFVSRAEYRTRVRV